MGKAFSQPAQASVSAVTVLVNYLGIRQSSQGPLFLFQDGRPMSRSYQANKYNALKRHCPYLVKITLGIQTSMRLMIVIVIDRRESKRGKCLFQTI
jgi:hypothetical protein